MDRDRYLENVAAARTAGHATAVPYPIRVRRLEVRDRRTVAPAMVRVTLGGRGAEGFVTHAPDDHVKLVFPDEDGGLRVPEPNGTMLRWPRPMPPTREYTVQRHDPGTGEIDIDLVVHPGGLASDWALAARPGDEVWVAGPPGGVIVPTGYDRYLLAGDPTALPAIARWLEEMPPDARGWVFVAVTDAAEQIDLDTPAGIAVTWVDRDDTLERAVRSVTVAAGESVYVWIAGEAGTIKPLRRWVRDDLGLGKDDHSITGYWKRGVAEYDDDHEDHDDGHAHG